MKVKEISNYVDCSIAIVYGTKKEFSRWLEERDRDVDLSDRVSMSGYIIIEGQILLCIWVSNSLPSTTAIGFIAREASLATDIIDRKVCTSCSSGNTERMPARLRARVIEKIVHDGSEMILEDKKHIRRGKKSTMTTQTQE